MVVVCVEKNKDELAVGRKLEMDLCEECQEKMKKVLTWKDAAKGAKNFNHLLKIFKQNLCDECLDKIMRAASK